MKCLQRWVGAVAVSAALVSVAQQANAQAIISNGTVRLGVEVLGNLNEEGGPASITGQTGVGVRYIKPGVGEMEYTFDGCQCEGWGVADVGSGVKGFANDSSGTAGLMNLGFSNPIPGVEAISHVKTTAANPVVFDVEHYFRPSASPNLYVADVTIKNIGTGAATDVRYRRTMDWDIEPTPFVEFVTIGGLPAANLIESHDNGFVSSDPLSGGGPLMAGTLNTNFTHFGATDHGANFTFSFGPLAPGGSKKFKIFYGGTDSVPDALLALGTVGAEVYSLGEPNIPTTDPAYSVSMFGFKGVGGTALPSPTPEPASLALVGSGLVGLVAKLRRRRRTEEE